MSKLLKWMSFSRWLTSLWLICIFLFVISGCVTTSVVKTPPPLPQEEIMSPAPHPHAVWIFGHWKHTRHGYVWVPGHWAHKPKPDAKWVPGHWKQVHGGWKWVSGHWG